MGKQRDPEPDPKPPEERDDVHVSTNRCPFCHDGIVVDGPGWVACRSCQARHHRACWQESGACASCGHDRYLTDAPQHGADAPRQGAGSAQRGAGSAQRGAGSAQQGAGSVRVVKNPRLQRLALVMASVLFASIVGSGAVGLLGYAEVNWAAWFLVVVCGLFPVGYKLWRYGRTGVDIGGLTRPVWSRSDREA